MLVFDSTNWTTPQTVHVYAVQDTRAEGDRVVVSSHSVISADPRFNGAAVRNVEVTVHDDDLAAIQVVEQDATRRPRRLDAGRRGHGDHRPDRPVPAPAGDAADLFRDARAAARATPGSRSPAPGLSLVGAGRVPDLDRRPASWETGVLVTVTGVDDFTRQDPHDTTISISRRRRARPPTPAYDAAADARVDVARDRRRHGRRRGGRDRRRHARHRLREPACTVPGAGDSYSLRLTGQPTAPVTVALLTDGQTDVTIGGRIALAAIGGLTALQQFSGDVDDRGRGRHTRGRGGARQLPRRGLRRGPADPDRERRRRRTATTSSPASRSTARA